MKQGLKAVAGFSLIELTLASAIFSMGLAGLSLLMLTAVTGTAEAGHQTLATAKASSLAELIALNSDASGHYVNPQAGVDAGCMDFEICSAEQMAARELGAWQYELSRELPRGSGLVCRDSTPDDGHAAEPACDGDGSLVVKVFWQELHHLDRDDAGRRRLVTRLSH
jgi:type IV pilus assembly protein PilV